jgi:hypothetical protein
MAYISQIQDLRSAQADRLSQIQYWLISELEAEGIEYGFWFYEDEAWERATSENMDGSSAYFMIDIMADRGTVDTAVSNVYNDLRLQNECGHSFDCCGCTFLQGIGVAQMFENRYVIYENWGRNI